jgi:hypothetical protein
MVETTVGGFAGSVELLICLEMARDVSDEKTNPWSACEDESMRPGAPK